MLINALKTLLDANRCSHTTGITWVTPSPESMTVPVKVCSLTLLDVQDAAKARTAWTAMYNPWTLNDSNMISAVFSRFSGGFSGGSVLVEEKRVDVSVHEGVS